MATKQSRFDILITATDRATAVVKAVNQSWSKAMDPIVKTGAAFSAFSKEAGFNKLGSAIGRVGEAAVATGQQIGGLIAPIVAVTGLSVAGVAAMTVAWGRFGAELLNTSRAIGISTTALQEMRSAASLVFVEADALAAGVKSLGDTMQDAMYGRNQEALVIMGRLGVRLKLTKDGAVDTETAFGDLAEAIARIKSPQVQGLVARTFGLEEALPLLQKGRKGVEELRDAVRRTGAVMSGEAIAAAAGFTREMSMLQLSLQGVQNAIAAELIPIVQPLLADLGRWLSANREIIATRIGEFVSGLAAAIREVDWQAVAQGAWDFVAAIKSAVDWIGGWQNAIIAVAVVMAGPLISAVVSLTLAMSSLAVQAGLVIFRLAALAIAGLPALTVAMAAAASAVGLTGLASAFLTLGAAIMVTPVGWIIAGIAAIVAVAWVLYENWDWIAGWWSDLWDWIAGDAEEGSKSVANSLDKNRPKGAPASPSAVPTVAGAGAGPGGAGGSGGVPRLPTGATAPNSFAGGGIVPPLSGTNGPIGGGGAALEVVVTFQNAPAGMRVNTSSAPGITADVRIDRSMPSFGGGP